MLAVERCSRSAAVRSTALSAGAIRNVTVLVLPVAMNLPGALAAIARGCGRGRVESETARRGAESERERKWRAAIDVPL